MRHFKKRQLKKYFRRAAGGMKRGKLTPFYANRVAEWVSWYIDHKYMTEFRPWWYDQDWSKYDLSAEHHRYFEKWATEMERISGIDHKRLNEYRLSIPKRKRLQPRPPRKEKEQPVRKLRNPQLFRIKTYGGYEYVTGEKVFEINGHSFFIHRNSGVWVVSDVTIGASVIYDERYKRAVERARTIITDNLDQYLNMAQKAI
ncbi:hypothetical protein [Cohnella sp. JJ-181]|uniref:hypothetical protein n=1 Tax=Cohnella rhizoplanae TaxID=2974897 RepID=UPI0022FF7943|nr:hypothetical protein [Cohnella sp. JJ-181]CAI6073137.1 hypothetical protein COHCIP112018_02373 [Cohnella sp. JJ-181]